MRLQKQFSFQSDQQYQNLAALAQKHDRKSVSALVQAIADEQISLGRAIVTHQEAQAILAAVSTLTERAQLTKARTFASFALNNLQMEEDLRSQLDNAYNAIASPWITQIEEFITQQQPFGLSYQDAAGRVWKYVVRFAEITFHQKRNYLDCWCEETEGNRDLSELQHNWTLRLDRIVDAAVTPTAGDWHNGLDYIEVEFNLLGGLAHAYQPRSNDVSDRWSSNADVPTRVITRNINNTFWFVREMLPYGKDCKVLAPNTVSNRVRDELKAALENYSE